MFCRDKSDEIDMLQRLKQGSEAAFVQVYDHYWQDLFNQAYKRLPRQEVVKELIQDLFTELWQKKNTLNIHTSLAGYLHNALRYKIFNYIKSELVREKYAASIRGRPFPDRAETEENVFFHELKAALEKEITHLPPQPKQVYRLKYEQGLSYAEIAETLQISVSTVEKHMIKALKIIRRNLQEYTV